MIKQLYPDIQLTPAAPSKQDKDTPLERLKRKVSEQMSVAPYMLKLKTRKPDVVDARVAFTKKAMKEGFDPNLIMDSINRDRTMIYHYLNRPF